MNGDHVGFAYVALHPLLDWSSRAHEGAGRQPARRRPPSAPPSTRPSRTGAPTRSGSRATRSSWRRPPRSPRRGSARPRTGARRSPSTSRRTRSSHRSPMTSARPSSRPSHSIGSDPTLKPVLDQVDQALGLIGGADAAFGWAGDSAVVVSAANGTPEGGLVVVPTDKAAADHLFTALRSFIAIGGAQQGITVTDESYNGTTITTVDLGDIAKLSGMAGAGDVTVLPSPPDGPRPDRLCGDRPGRRGRLRVRASSSTSSTPPRTPRSPRTIATRRWPTVPGTAPARPGSTSPRSAA